MRSAWCSPHAVTHAAHPLQRSETKIEKMPPDPGLFFSGVAKIAFALWNAIGTLSMTPKNSSFAAGEKPLTAWVTSRMNVSAGVLSFLATASRIRSRVCLVISGSSLSIFCRSPLSVT